MKTHNYVMFYTLQPENTLSLNAPQIQEGEPPADEKTIIKYLCIILFI